MKDINIFILKLWFYPWRKRMQ